jgi:hypothetical protein
MKPPKGGFINTSEVFPMQRFRTFISTNLKEETDSSVMSSLPYYALKYGKKAANVVDQVASVPNPFEYSRQKEKMNAAIARGDNEEADRIQDEMDAIVTGGYLTGTALELGAAGTAATGVGAVASPFLWAGGVAANIASGIGDIQTSIGDVKQAMGAKSQEEQIKQLKQAAWRAGSGVLGIATSAVPGYGAGKALYKTGSAVVKAEKAANAAVTAARRAGRIESKVKNVSSRAVDEYERLKTLYPPGHPERRKAFRKAEYATSKADEATAKARAADIEVANMPKRSERIATAVKTGVKTGEIPIKPISSRVKSLVPLLTFASSTLASGLGNALETALSGKGKGGSLGGGGAGGGGAGQLYVSSTAGLGGNVRPLTGG